MWLLSRRRVICFNAVGPAGRVIEARVFFFPHRFLILSLWLLLLCLLFLFPQENYTSVVPDDGWFCPLPLHLPTLRLYLTCAQVGWDLACAARWRECSVAPHVKKGRFDLEGIPPSFSKIETLTY